MKTSDINLHCRLHAPNADDGLLDLEANVMLSFTRDDKPGRLYKAFIYLKPGHYEPYEPVYDFWFVEAGKITNCTSEDWSKVQALIHYQLITLIRAWQNLTPCEKIVQTFASHPKALLKALKAHGFISKTQEELPND